MEDEIKRILTIEVQGETTVKSLKQEISDLKDALLNVEEGSEDYKKILEQLITDQKKLTSVMNAGKNEVEAAKGSYNALSQEMSALKKVWKEVTDEASRNQIGARINEINSQLKEMDASVGVFSRNVGNYEGAIVDATKNIMSNLGQISPELGSMGKTINSLIPLIQKTTKIATNGLKGIKAALVSTGVGALVVALGLLVANWDKVSKAIANVIPWMKKANDETKAQVEANDKLIESNKAASDEMEFQARIMAAQGESALQIIEYKKKETEAILANTNAQIKETEAKIASIKAHSAFGRWIRGENKQLEGLEESLEALVKEQKSLADSVKRYGEDIVVEQAKIEFERTKASKNGSDNRVKIEKAEADKRLKEIESFIAKAKSLMERYYSDEERRLREFADENYTITMGMYGSIVKEVKNQNLPFQLGKALDDISFDEFPENVIREIQKIFKAVDPEENGATITNNLKEALDNIDLEGLDKNLQKKFKEAINKINIVDVPKDIQKKLDDAFSNVEFSGVVFDLREIFKENESIIEIINQFNEAYIQTQEYHLQKVKEANAEEVSSNADKLFKIREQEEKNAIDLIKLNAETQEILLDDKDPEHRLKQLEVNHNAEVKIYNERIKTAQSYIDEYNRIINEENITDDEKLRYKEEKAQKEIELSNTIIEQENAELQFKKEKAKEEERINMELIQNISDFGNAVGDILGSIADYWLDMVESKVQAGEMSQAEGERQFEHIKALQIAQTTIQTIAAAMAAFNGITSATGGWGIAAAAAEMAAVLTTGAFQIAKIKNTQLNASPDVKDSTSPKAQIRTITTDFTPEYVAAKTGASETENLANAVGQQNIYVNVVEVENLMGKRKARATETTY